MANNDAAANGMDYPEHERTYERFVVFAKWGSIAVTAIIVFMAVTLL